MLNKIIDGNALINKSLKDDHELSIKMEEITYYQKQLEQVLRMLPPDRVKMAEKIIIIMSNMDIAKNAVNYYAGYQDALKQPAKKQE